MATFEELDELNSKELHDRAVDRAQRHLDVAFFYRLLRAIPAAEAATGDVDDSEADVFHLTSLVGGFFDADEGELADALRPFYIDYLMAHPD